MWAESKCKMFQSALYPAAVTFRTEPDPTTTQAYKQERERILK